VNGTSVWTNTLRVDSSAGGRIVVIGLGGLGCPALWALGSQTEASYLLIDDDTVSESNLARQILYEETDLGAKKVAAARERLVQRGVPRAHIDVFDGRLEPDNARALLRGARVVIEGTDDYATKFLCADTCYLERVPVVHGAALGWQATAWCVSETAQPCYRCLFEDVPDGAVRTCATAGVIGPVTGIAGALLAELALSVLEEKAPHGVLFAYDGLKDRLRKVPIASRPDCPLCGREPRIFAVDELRYPRQTCADQTPRSHADERHHSHPHPS
jgi:molybdopterin/thiamine biosynthesis adenylyltransferase